MWSGTGTPALTSAYRSATRTVDLLAPTAAADYTPASGVVYPDAWPGGDLSNALQDTAQLIKADLGTSVVAIDFGSWDMHSDYGTTEWGDMQQHDRRVRRCAVARSCATSGRCATGSPW